MATAKKKRLYKAWAFPSVVKELTAMLKPASIIAAFIHERKVRSMEKNNLGSTFLAPS
jgi:hypothetical protein